MTLTTIRFDVGFQQIAAALCLAPLEAEAAPHGQLAQAESASHAPDDRSDSAEIVMVANPPWSKNCSESPPDSEPPDEEPPASGGPKRPKGPVPPRPGNLRKALDTNTLNGPPEILLKFYGYRYLDPLTGRWPSRDPIGEFSFFSKFTESVNFEGLDYLIDDYYLAGYLFVENQPTNDHDKLGLFSCPSTPQCYVEEPVKADSHSHWTPGEIWDHKRKGTQAATVYWNVCKKKNHRIHDMEVTLRPTSGSGGETDDGMNQAQMFVESRWALIFNGTYGQSRSQAKFCCCCHPSVE